MEVVEGDVLRGMLRAGPIPLQIVISIAAQITDGLAKAHAAGVVHRDLKPENLMVSRDGLVKILDFGLAKVVTPDTDPLLELETVSTSETNSGVLLGTVPYMSPEQASGLPLDFRSDQFSFGSLLYEMVTGKRAFPQRGAAQIFAAILEDEPKPIPSLNPKVPAALEIIVHRCMAKKPEKRYASTQELVRDLKKIRESSVAEDTRSLSAIAGRHL